jgi:hypothetical protein
MSNTKKAFYVDDQKVRRNKIPIDAKHLGTNKAFFKSPVSKKMVQLVEEFYTTKL